jgi:CheY-like chemotaxis protein
MNADRPARILVVDDNEDATRVLTLAFCDKGYDLRAAHDAGEALELAAKFRPNIAIVDIGMPVMDGYELAVQLRKLPGLKRMHLIALTGFSEVADRGRARAAGFDHHLVKPVEIDALERVLAAMGGAAR